MNYRELIAQLSAQVGAGEARAIVRLVMEERFGLSLTDLLLGKDTTLSADDRAEFEKIATRLLSGEPVQYILGFTDFCRHRFRVTPAVLIPRPETEELVQWAIAINNHYSTISILDLCTGSGCIATSLALAYPEAHVVAVDISEEALVVARENAATLGVQNIEFIRQDILSYAPIPSSSTLPLQPIALGSQPPTLNSRLSTSGFHLLTANPPYVRASEARDMTRTVLDYEPHMALFVPDEDPLLFYRAIAHIALHYLSPGGHLLLEINCAFAEEVRQLLTACSFRDIEIRDDQFGRPRMIHALH